MALTLGTSRSYLLASSSHPASYCTRLPPFVRSILQDNRAPQFRDGCSRATSPAQLLFPSPPQPSQLQAPNVAASSSFLSSSVDLGPPTSAYVHLPFCKRRCFYCDFPIVALGQRNSSHNEDIMKTYVEFLIREMSAILKYGHAVPLKTVFFGGGTPSLLPPALLQRIITTLESLCGFQTGVEISLEMDPGTFDLISLNEFIGCGVNRLSLGVQAFQEELLRHCGRTHGLRDIHEAIRAIHANGLKNWSLDLISSLPYQTMQLWEESLSKAMEARPAHISVYDLQVEEGTKFWQWYKPGQAPLPTDDKAAQFYTIASSVLKDGGYEHYEISNYAKTGHQCIHNLVYWHNSSYYGFGLGSTSYVQGRRFSRPKKLKEYFDFVKVLETSSGDITGAEESMQEKVCDTLMLAFRLAEGLDIRDFRRKFGLHFSIPVIRALLPFVESGHAIALDADNHRLCSDALLQLCDFALENASSAWSGDSKKVSSGTEVAFIRLSDPEGFLFSNEIISSVFSSLPS